MPDDSDDLSWYEEPEDFPHQKKPWSTKTPAVGLFKFLFPWLGGNINVEWPATGRQAMMTLCVVIPTFCLCAAICSYIIFVGATPENISRFGQMVRRDSTGNKPEQYRQPEQVPVKTNDGIEIIEVCPPCPMPNCEEDCPCADCPICPTCPTKEMAPPPMEKTGPLLTD